MSTLKQDSSLKLLVTKCLQWHCYEYCPNYYWGRHGHMLDGFTTIYTIRAYHQVVSLNPAHVEVYSIQHYVWQVGGFLWTLQFPPPI